MGSVRVPLLEIAQGCDWHRVAVAPPGAVAIRQRVRWMTRARWPGCVDERVVEVLLNVVDKLLNTRRDAERRDVRGGIVDDTPIACADGTNDVALEQGHCLGQAKRF